VTRLLFSGYYGYGNAGDEAVLAGLVGAFRSLDPEGGWEMTALSGDPAGTRAAHGIGAVGRYKPSALLPALARTDILLSGGGSLLQDVTSAHGIFYYLAVVRLAQMLGKKTMFIAQGIGPLLRPRSRRLVRAVAQKLDAVTVRDEESARLLREIGVSRPPLEVTADPALLLGPDPLPHRDRASDAFGVALRPWHGQEGLAGHVADACLPVLSGRRALLLPMQPEADKAAAEQFGRKWHQGNEPGNRVTLCQAGRGLMPLLVNVQSCGMMIGMRLHALILAAACGVPSVALSYDPKVDAFMQMSGQGDAVYDLRRPDPDRLTALFARVWAERAARGAALELTLPSLRARARRNAERAQEIVGRA
jgi:polysaccharide pyruvyl transferase CsaB